MMDKRAKIVEALRLVLAAILERRLDDVPMFLKPMLKNLDLSPATLLGSIEDILTEDDWIKLEGLFTE